MSSQTYTLEEVAERTGAPLEAVREAVEAGNLSLTQTSGSQEQRVTSVEMERWWQMAQEHKRIEEQPAQDQPPGSAEG